MAESTGNSGIYLSESVAVYDHCPAPKFDRVLEYITFAFPKPGRVFDVGCGTGSLLAALRLRGWAVEGCDPSLAMVAAARLKNPDCEILRKDATDFLPAHPVDLITCTFDVLNYMPSLKQIEIFFGRCFEHLKPGGILVFDSVTPDDIAVNWPRYIEIESAENFYLVRSGAHLRECIGRLTYELFTRQQDGCWRRSTEIHELRALQRDWTEQQLKLTGYCRISTLDAAALEEPSAHTVRWLFSAQKP